MRTTGFILLLFVSFLSTAQTVISASPAQAVLGDNFTVGITTSGPVNNPYSIKLVKGNDEITYNTSYQLIGNTYYITYHIKEYLAPGYYHVKVGSNISTVPILVSSPQYREEFNYLNANNVSIGLKENDGIKKIATDSQGNIYCVGSFYNGVTFGTTTLTANGLRDGFIVKYDSSKTVQWVRTIGSANDALYEPEGLTSVKVFNDSIIYVSGYVISDSTLSLNKTTPLNYPKRNSLSQDGILMKFNSAGNLIWHAFQGSKFEDATNDLAINRKGEIFLTGYLQGDLIYYLGNDTCFTYVYSSDLSDSISLKALADDEYGLYIASYAPDGKINWAKREDRAPSYNFNGIGVALNVYSDNSIAVLASTFSPISFDGVLNANAMYSSPHYALLKVDSLGNRIWGLESGHNSTGLSSLGIDQWDNLYLPNTYLTNTRAELRKYKPNGNLIWTKPFHNNRGAAHTNYYSVTDQHGNTYVNYKYQDEWAANKYNIGLKKIDSGGTALAVIYPKPYTVNDKNAPTALSLNTFENKVFFTGIYRDSQTFGTTTLNSGLPKVFFSELSISKSCNSYSLLNDTSCGNYTSPSGNYVWTSPDTYFDTIPNMANCDSIITINLTIANSSNSTISERVCDSYISPSGKYVWTSSNTYTDTVPNSVNCDSIITINLVIDTVNSSITQNTNMLSANENGGTYQWVSCPSMSIINGATNQTFIASKNGDYAVIVTKNGCSDTSACHNVNGIGIIESDFESNLTLYPNPTEGDFIVDLGEYQNAVSIKITSISGKLIQSSIFSDTQILDLKLEGPSGVYFLKVESGKNYAVFRLIKE